MSNQRVTLIGASIVFAVGGFIAGRSTCPKPADGNPVGFHLHGQAQVDKNDLTCSANAPCNLSFDVTIGKDNAQPAAVDCRTANCLHFHGNNMLVQSTDDATPHPWETVNADGTVQSK